ncbi:MAG: hypothetical protein GY714_07600 [Desulfobacterales bacterium]|nr:hypothetical protein [Desulfobacterales bacterium]MCP4161388.1 hypothetical protein [Deltaproteobacteria bacterium]
MIYIFNYIGVGFVAGGIAIYAALVFLTSKIPILPPNSSGSILLIPSALFLVLIDLWYRRRSGIANSLGGIKYIKPSSGGHIFFIPIWVLALPILLLGIAAPKNVDSRYAYVKTDVKILKSKEFSGDIELSKKIKQMFESNLIEQADASKFKVFSKHKNNKLIVLVYVPNLKKFPKDSQIVLADLLDSFLKKQFPTKVHYFGFRGKYVFGVGQGPDGRTHSGTKSALASYYGAKKSE